MLRIGLCKYVSISRAVVAAGSFNRRFSTETGRKLEGKVALITGAASGIGKETAAKFISNGARVVIADIQHQLGQETAKQLGPNASFIACDVTKESDVSNAVDFTVSEYNQLDIMYNNAGMLCETSPSVADLDLEVFDKVMGVNVRGALAGIKHSSRVMIPRRSGSILCTSSVAGVMGGLGGRSYSVSKSAIIGIVRSVAAELCSYGIRINCISPFAILTPLLMEELHRIYPGVEDPQLVKITQNTGALQGANCEAIDVANAALYLASDDAKYVSGHNLVVDGGFTTFKTLTLPAPDSLIGQGRTATSSWADLPPDLIQSVSNRLGLIDLLSFRGVCQNWNLSSLTPSAEIESLSCHEPWFLLYGGENSRCSLVSENGKKYLINVPELSGGATCIASKEGWILVYREGSLFFFCPFSRSKIELPQFPYSVLKDRVAAAFSSSPTCEDCIVSVICQNDEMDIVLYSLSHGAAAWTERKHSNKYFKNVKAAAYANEKLYVFDDSDTLLRFDPEEDVKWVGQNIVASGGTQRSEPLPIIRKVSCLEEKSIIKKLGLQNDVWITSCGTIVPTDRFLKLYFNESISNSQESESCRYKGVWITPRFHQISP
ncbi:hypothetical protein LWI29_001652 [Acer saccharum]|uniref:(21S)-21-acetoxyl-apo-melianone synthase SDR n=1 Tax=Acer saccharum TaxID=4024 RepID=A0AA39RVK0_ACESA|nr:hypothetical protein LWI29_001652 [Acer saccharum]